MIDQIKRTLHCRDLIERAYPDIQLRDSGDHWRCVAPYRDEANPSLCIYKDRDKGWYDFGAGQGGSVIDLAMVLWSCDMKSAIERLQGIVGGPTRNGSRPPAPSPTPSPSNAAPKKPLPTPKVLQQWHQALMNDPERLGWWKEYRCVSPDVLADMTIGYGGQRYTIPIYDADGELANVRLYAPGSDDNKVLSWGAGYGSTRLYPHPATIGSPSVVVCEGEGDCLALMSAGIPAVTRTTGAQTKWSNAHTQALQDAAVDAAIVAFDNDDPGRKGAAQCAGSLQRAGLDVRVLQWPDDRPDHWDITDELREHGTESLQSLLDAATPWTPANGATPSLPDPFKLTDIGNGERFAAHHGKVVRYCHAWRRWLIWDGTRWNADDCGQVRAMAKQTVRRIYNAAARTADDNRRQALAKHATRSENEARITAMLRMAESEPGIPVLPDDLDADPWLLNCANGTLDLRTGELRKHDQRDLITKRLAVAYNPDAPCARWRQFLREVMGEGERDPDEVAALVAFVQRAVGYALTGDTREDVLFVLYGTGSNGKSTFLAIVKDLLADYAMQTPASTLLASRHDSIPNDVARLKGARFVCAVETDEGRRLAEGMVKAMTGGDTITARFMRAEWFEFTPAFKLWLAANHRPVIRGTDYAIWRRIRLIPWTVQFATGDERANAAETAKAADPDLTATLRRELPGILAWAVRGCLDWQQNGLGTPDTVRAATAEYRQDMDVIAAFLDECCILDPQCEVGAAELYRAYCGWCDASGERPVAQRRFGERLTERGIERIKRSRIVLLGIGLRSDREAS